MTQDDVYFNAKAAFEQRMQDIAAKAEADEEEKEKQQNIMTGAAALGFLVGMLCYPVILLLLWNWLMPGLFGFATIGYFKAAALIIIGRILFKHD
jgi:hypothetical protein